MVIHGEAHAVGNFRVIDGDEIAWVGARFRIPLREVGIEVYAAS